MKLRHLFAALALAASFATSAGGQVWPQRAAVLSGVKAAPLYTPAFFDRFANAGAQTALNGRTVAGVTWTSGSNGSPNALQVSASPGGTLLGGNNTNSYTYVATGTVKPVLVVAGTRNVLSEWDFHLTTGAGTANPRVALLTTTAGASLKMYNSSNTAGSGGTGLNSLFTDTNDELAMLVTPAGVFTPYVNGFQVATPIDMTAFPPSGGVITLTGNHGINAKTALSTVMADGFGFGDPTSAPMVLLEQGGRVLQRNADNTLTIALTGKFFGSGAPDAAHMRYSVIDLATRLPIAGFDHQPIVGYTVTGMRFSGSTATISASAVTAATSGVQVWVYRSDTTDGSEWPSHGGRIDAGQAILVSGQSQAFYMLLPPGGATGFTGTAPLNGKPWTTEAFRGTLSTSGISPNSAISARVNPVVADTNAAVIANIVYAGTGQLVNIINAGVGGVTVIERGPGTDNFAGVVEGLLRAGNMPQTGMEISGTGEVEKSNPAYATAAAGIADWSTQVVRYWDAIEALNGGRRIKVIVSPYGELWNKGNDGDAQAMRHAQWKLIQDNPGRFYEGGWSLDIQHDATYTHYSAAGNRVNAIRNGNAYALMMGYSGARREGGGQLLATGQSRTSTTVTLQVSDTEAATMTADNMAAQGDYRLGFDFSSSSSFATYMIPTAVSVGTAVSGVYPVTWTFASVGGPVYVRCMYGAEPIGRNPGTSGSNGTQANATNNTIRATLDTQASMLRSNYASGNKAAVRPYFTTDATDTLLVP